MTAYSTAQKAMACEVVRRNAGVIDAGVMAEIRAMLSNPRLPDQTVRNWVKSFLGDQKKQATDLPTESALSAENLQSKASQKLDVALEELAQKLISHASRPEVIGKANVQQAMTSLGIAVDKMRLLRGLPTEIVAILPDLVETIRRKGYDPIAAFTKMRDQLSQLPDVPMVTPSHGAS